MESRKLEMTEMLDKNFFASDIEVDISRVFPIVIMSTMSSGKSTLVNALLGADILPSENKACTAKIYSVLDDDTLKEPKIYITKRDGKVIVVDDNFAEKLSNANNDDEVRDVLIAGSVNGVLNTEKALLLIDTPGLNNSRDVSHEEITYGVLKKIRSGLILYVINATQMGINDDYVLLTHLRDYLKTNTYVKLLFVVNKVDNIDFEKESLENFLFEIKRYIEHIGIEKPDIVPISALAANLFKKVLNGERLTRIQSREFLQFYDLFRTSDMRMVSYAMTKDLPKQFEKVKMLDEEFTVAELLAAIENTGITYVEKYIQKMQILSSGNTNVKVNLKK